jgi:hypothetical protein
MGDIMAPMAVEARHARYTLDDCLDLELYRD